MHAIRPRGGEAFNGSRSTDPVPIPAMHGAAPVRIPASVHTFLRFSKRIPKSMRSSLARNVINYARLCDRRRERAPGKGFPFFLSSFAAGNPNEIQSNHNWKTNEPEKLALWLPNRPSPPSGPDA